MSKKEQDLLVYGFEEDKLLAFSNEKKKIAGDVKMSIMSMLSDAQELMAIGQFESARKTINVAKYLIDKDRQKEQADNKILRALLGLHYEV